MTEMFGEAWSPMSVPDLAPDDDDDYPIISLLGRQVVLVLYADILGTQWLKFNPDTSFPFS